MNKRFFSLGLAAALMLLSASAFAHGVGARVSTQNPFAFEFYYSTGETMAYTPVKVFSPDDPKIAYQEGFTDDQGRFAFVPIKDGTWKVVCEADGGHRAEAKVDVDMKVLNSASTNGAKDLKTEGSSFPQGKQLFINGLLGVSLLFNLSVLILLLRRKKR